MCVWIGLHPDWQTGPSLKPDEQELDYAGFRKWDDVSLDHGLPERFLMQPPSLRQLMLMPLSTVDPVVGHAEGGEPPDVTARLRNGGASASGARSILRTTTQAIHERLHRHPGLSRLAAGTVDRDEYRQLLARSYGFYAAVEPMLVLARVLTDCLAEDLAELGVSADKIAALPRCAPPPIGHGHAELIGARYVLLGASLGGKVMARALASRASDAAVLPVRFLTGTSADDWSSFAADLDANLPDAAAQNRAAAAAVSVFAAYEEWMSA